MLFFFFSSRRRHTRFDCDWSSDVCSSDLSFWTAPARTTSPRKRWLRAASKRLSPAQAATAGRISACPNRSRSEEHTSELQSQSNLVCRLLLEKKKPLNIKNLPFQRNLIGI